MDINNNTVFIKLTCEKEFTQTQLDKLNDCMKLIKNVSNVSIIKEEDTQDFLDFVDRINGILKQ